MTTSLSISHWSFPASVFKRKTTSLFRSRMDFSTKSAWYCVSQLHVWPLQQKVVYQYAQPCLSAFRRSYFSTKSRRYSKRSSENRINTEVYSDLLKYNIDVARSARAKNRRSRHPCGEDASAVCESRSMDSVFISVFDGVGGYATMNVDPAEFSNLLAERCETAFTEDSTGTLKDVLERGYESAARQRIVGGSTAVLAKYIPDTNRMEVVNLGDSKAMHFRRNTTTGEYELLNETTEQEHFFNCPYQLSFTERAGNYGDSPRKADEYNFDKFMPDDVVVLATDGITDNLFIEDIARTLSHTHSQHEKEEVQGTFSQVASEALTKAAYKKCQDDERTPFEVRSHGQFRGGKLDDMTNVVIYFNSGKSPQEKTPEEKTLEDGPQEPESN